MRVQPKQSDLNFGGINGLAPLAVAFVVVGALAFAKGIALVVALVVLCMGALFAVASAWFVTRQRRVDVVSDGDRLFVTSYFGGRRMIGERDAGSISVVAIVEPKFRDTWMVWLDGTGAPTWAALGRNWPLDDLERAALLFGLERTDRTEAMTRAQSVVTFPGVVTWFQLHSASLFISSLYAVIVVAGSVGLALFHG